MLFNKSDPICFSLTLPAEQSAMTEVRDSDHPYEKFLASQKRRELEWKAARDSKRAKTAKSSAPLSTTSSDLTSSSENPSLKDNVVTLLRQQLASQTEVCCRLVKRLDPLEEATTKILSCQMQMQENILKVTTNSFP